jgi:hypothetical protein
VAIHTDHEARDFTDLQYRTAEMFNDPGIREQFMSLVLSVTRQQYARNEFEAIELIRECMTDALAVFARRDYQEYLATEHWQTVRRAALERASHRCQLCSSLGPLNVHHRTYSYIARERAEDVIVLCRDCHAKFHDKLP